MATMGPLEYARKYWDLEVPIINDDNEVVRYEKVKFSKYRLFQGWGKNPPVDPPGLPEFRSAVISYADRIFKQGKAVELEVKNIWGYTSYFTLRSSTEAAYRQVLSRSVLAFIGKGSPEDIQLTLQLAARCGVAKGTLSQYCEQKVDDYARLGLDCNGFVGNYLCYRDPAYTWGWVGQQKTTRIHGDMGINTLCRQLAPQPVKHVANMLPARVHVLGMVNGSGTVIEGGAGGVGHIMITQARYFGFQPAMPPIPQKYVGKQCLVYTGVESTPSAGLSEFNYTILEIDDNGVATVWRDKVRSTIRVKIYPAN